MDNDLCVISGYSRAQALADGVLVECSEPKLFRYPVALTRGAWDLCVALTPAAQDAGNDEKGRLWDVLWMAWNAARRANGKRDVPFHLLCVTDRPRPSRIVLRVHLGPGDDGEPVFTIMLPGED